MKKQQHRAIKCQNGVEQDFAAVTTLCELLLHL